MASGDSVARADAGIKWIGWTSASEDLVSIGVYARLSKWGVGEGEPVMRCRRTGSVSRRRLQCRCCGVARQVVHCRQDAAAGKFHAGQLEAHFTACERGHQREVVAVAQMPDAEHAAL